MSGGAERRVLVAMSGGVDSSAAVILLLEQGYDCVGATMRLYDGDEAQKSEKGCCSLADVEDARRAAYALGIGHYVFNYTEDFARDVMERFVCAYARGETPNPCIDCNRYLKFGRLLQRAEELDCGKIATGHYASVRFDAGSGRYLLRRGRDRAKDQSYVLWPLRQFALSRTVLPLGELTKAEVRALAEAHGLKNAWKKESQDICFVPDGDYGTFIERYTGKTYPAGDFLDADGNVLGRHRGVIRYTLGQRKGLGLALPAPLYVREIDPAANTVTLAPNDALFSKTLVARDVNLIAAERLTGPVRVEAKVRYRQQEQKATAEQIGEDALRVTFDEPQRAVTKGQSVVLYDGETVVGGGIISEAG